MSSACTTPKHADQLAYYPLPPATPRVVHLVSFNRLHDLIRPKPTLLQVIRGGTISPYVEVPAGIAYRAGHLYICDTGRGVVHDWELATGQAKRIGSSGNAVLITPVDVAVDAAGHVFVADSGRGEVVAFDAAGITLFQAKPPDREGYRPVSVAVSDSTLFVADIDAHHVDLFTNSADSEGRLAVRFEGSIGGVGSGAGKFYYPMGVAVNNARGMKDPQSAGTLAGVAVSDMMNARVQLFDSPNPPGKAGQATLSFGQPGNRYGDMGKPKHLDIGPDGTIVIADAEFARVHMFNSKGELLLLVGSDEDVPGATLLPLGIAVAPHLPERVAQLVPDGFDADYFFFVTNSVGSERISLYAVGAQVR